jgi:transposase-like protein
LYLGDMTKKRARRGRDEWKALVTELAASGHSMSAFARERGISPGNLSYWKEKLGDKKAGVGVAPKSKALFSEVVVMPRVGTTPPRIEVVTRRGAAIRLEGAFDASLLREVLRVVESC